MIFVVGILLGVVINIGMHAAGHDPFGSLVEFVCFCLIAIVANGLVLKAMGVL